MKRLALLTVAAIALAAPAPAVAAIYWGHDNSIGVANLDLSQRTDSIDVSAWGFGLAVDSAHLYYGVASNEGSIGRANLDGSESDNGFVDGLEFPSGLAVDGPHVYWADRLTNQIGRANLDGSGVERDFIDGADYPCGVAVDGSYLYWSNRDSNAIGRAWLDGTHVEQEFLSEVDQPCSVAVTPTQIYWTSLEGGAFDPGSIGRAPIAGGPVENEFIPDIYEAFSLAADSTHLYWTDEGWENLQQGDDPTAVPAGAVGRARLDGTEVERRWIPTALAHGVAVDSRVLTPPPPPPPTPSWYLRFGRLTHERSGAIRLVVFVPGPGAFTVDSRAIGWQVKKASVRPGAGFARWTLKLWPGKGTPAARRIRRQLGRQGRAPFVLRLTYTQEGHLPLQSSKRLAFLRQTKR